MSKTLFVEYQGRGFWAYDVAAGILLKHVIDAAEPIARRSDTNWLSRAIALWRVNAITSDMGLHIDETWSTDQTKAFVELIEEACRRLEKRDSLPARELEAWNILDNQGVFPRGAKEVATAPVIELGRAIVELVKGTLPKAPPGTLWLYGTETGRQTVKAG